MDQHIPIREAASKLACSEDTIRRLIKAGRLPALRLGGGTGAIRINEKDISLRLSIQPRKDTQR